MIEFFKDFGLILLVCKGLGIACKRIKIPQVVGEIAGGLILGPCLLNIIKSGETISLFAEIGVMLMMFSAGLGTNLKKLRKTGRVSFFMALVGVIVPLIGGTALYSLYYGFGEIGSKEFYTAIFIGTIMTATSVSITVATLQELGKLTTTLGTAIVSAAVIDDVIGMIVLTCVIGAASGNSGGVAGVFIKTVLFFGFAVMVGFIINRIIEALDKKFPHTQRIPVFSLACCFLMAYVAEKVFGIADITGAYLMGVALASVDDAQYIEKKVDISAYMIFAPVFFANIGLQTSFKNMTGEMVVFSILFVLVALVCKIIGCGTVAKLSGFSLADSLKAGIGMMTRGEVALIVAQKGLAINIIDSSYFSAVILLIIVSSIATPLLLSALYKKEK